MIHTPEEAAYQFREVYQRLHSQAVKVANETDLIGDPFLKAVCTPEIIHHLDRVSLLTKGTDFHRAYIRRMAIAYSQNDDEKIFMRRVVVSNTESSANVFNSETVIILERAILLMDESMHAVLGGDINFWHIEQFIREDFPESFADPYILSLNNPRERPDKLVRFRMWARQYWNRYHEDITSSDNAALVARLLGFEPGKNFLPRVKAIKVLWGEKEL